MADALHRAALFYIFWLGFAALSNGKMCDVSNADNESKAGPHIEIKLKQQDKLNNWIFWTYQKPFPPAMVHRKNPKSMDMFISSNGDFLKAKQKIPIKEFLTFEKGRCFCWKNWLKIPFFLIKYEFSSGSVEIKTIACAFVHRNQSSKRPYSCNECPRIESTQWSTTK